MPCVTLDYVCRGAANDFDWRLVNGLWSVILALGLLYTTLTVRQARSWLYFKGWIRSFIADYGVPLLVVIWSESLLACDLHHQVICKQ